MKKSKIESNKGITLIALVITIIVLLILAGVSIATLTGNNGILSKATKAKDETIIAQEKELIKIAYGTALSEKTNNEKVTASDLKSELDQLTGDKEATEVGEAPDVEGDIIVKFNETENQYRVKSNGSIDKYTGELPPKKEPTTVEEAKKDNTIFEKNTPLNDETITIPAGFRIAEDSPTDITKGVVVKDDNENEYVWIPCTLEEYNKQRNTETDWTSKQWYYNGGEWGDAQPNKEEVQNSIKTNKGFYVARYEAGVPENAKEFYANSDGAEYKQTEKNTDQYKPVSKKGVQAWNFIDQTHAKTVAQNMIENNDGVKSYLIDSHAWDTICRVIRKYDSDKNLIDSTKWGNNYNNLDTKYEELNTLYALHQRSSDNWDSDWICANVYKKGQVPVGPKGIGDNRLELSTGASDDFKAFNIYDLAGNMWEWTTENGIKPNDDGTKTSMKDLSITDISEAENGVIRGGFFGGQGEVDTVVSSDGNPYSSVLTIQLGFRVVLYLK